MRSSWRHFVRTLAIAVVCTVTGCRESAVDVHPAPPTSRSITPRVTVTRDGPTTAILTVALDVGPDVPKIASFTGRLHFDPTALRCDGEIPLADSTTRASNCVGDVIRVAGISPTGVNPARLAAFHFQVIRASGLDGTRFELEELHDVARTNVRALLRPATPGTP